MSKPATAYTPRHLGRKSDDAVDEVDLVEWTGQPITVLFDCVEFTSLCPVTGQPDFGSIRIEYQPGKHIIETKSLKLFLRRYRDRAAFNEVIVDEIATALFAQAKPKGLTVTGAFNTRGGIAPTVVAHRGRA